MLSLFPSIKGITSLHAEASRCWVGFDLAPLCYSFDWFHAIVLHQVVELSYRCIWKWTAYCGLKRTRTMKQSFNIWLIDNISENSMHMRGRAFAYNVCIHACLFAGKEPIVYYTMEKQHSTGRWILTKGQLGGCIWTTLNEYKSFCLMVFMHVCRCTHIHDGMNCLLICSFASAAWHLWWTQPRFHSYQPHCGCHSLSFSQNRQPKHAWHDFWTYSESSFEPNHVPLAVMQKRLTAQNLWISFSWETWSNHIKPNIHSNPISVSNQTSGGSVAKSSELMSWYLGSAVSHVARQGPNHGTKPLPKLVQVNRLFNDCKLYFLYPYTCMYKSWLNMFIVSYIYIYVFIEFYRCIYVHDGSTQGPKGVWCCGTWNPFVAVLCVWIDGAKRRQELGPGEKRRRDTLCVWIIGLCGGGAGDDVT